MEVTEDQIIQMLLCKNAGNRSEFISIFNTINKFSQTVDGFIYFLNGVAKFTRQECIDFAFGIVRKWLLNSFSNIPEYCYPMIIQLLFQEVPKKDLFLLLPYRFSVIKLQAVAIYHLSYQFPDFWQKLFLQDEFYVFDFLSSFSYIIMDYQELINNHSLHTTTIFDPDELDFKAREKTISLQNLLLTCGIENRILSYLLEKVLTFGEFDHIFVNSEGNKSENHKLPFFAAKTFILISSWVDISLLLSTEMFQLLSNLFQHQPTFVIDVFCAIFKHPISYDSQIDILNAMKLPERIEAFDLKYSEILEKSEHFHISLSTFLKSIVSNLIEHEISQKYYKLAFSCFSFLNPIIYLNLKEFFSQVIQLNSLELNQQLVNAILTAISSIIQLNWKSADSHLLLIHCFDLLSMIGKIQHEGYSMAIYLIQILSQLIGPDQEINVLHLPQIASVLTAFYDFLDHENHRGINIIEILDYIKPIMTQSFINLDLISFNSYCISVGIFSQLFIEFVDNKERQINESDKNHLDCIQLIFLTCSKCLNSLLSNEIDSLALTNLEDSIVNIVENHLLFVLQIPTIDQIILFYINSSSERLNICASRLISQIQPSELKIELYCTILNHFSNALTKHIEDLKSDNITLLVITILTFVKRIDAYNEPLFIDHLSAFLVNYVKSLFHSDRLNISILDKFIEASFSSLHFRCLPFLIDLIIEHFNIRMCSLISIFDFYEGNEIIFSVINLFLDNKTQLFLEIKKILSNSDISDGEEERELLISFRHICSFVSDFVLYLQSSFQDHSMLLGQCLIFIQECYSLCILKKTEIDKINTICLNILNQSNESIIWTFSTSVFIASLKYISLRRSTFLKNAKLHFEQTVFIIKKCIEIDINYIQELINLLQESNCSEYLDGLIKAIIENDSPDYLSLYSQFA